MKCEVCISYSMDDHCKPIEVYTALGYPNWKEFACCNVHGIETELVLNPSKNWRHNKCQHNLTAHCIHLPIDIHTGWRLTGGQKYLLKTNK